MEHDLFEKLNILDAKLDRIRQLLGDNINEEQLNEIFGEIPEIEEEEEPKREPKKNIDLSNINKIKMKPKEEEEENGKEWDD